MKRIILIIAILLFSSYVEAKNLYVNSADEDCSDTTVTYANNTLAVPWCTLGRALWGHTNEASAIPGEAVQEGDTVLVYPATYTAPSKGNRWGVAFNPINSGSSESLRIIIRAVGTVYLAQTATVGGPIFGANARHYITWDGFTSTENNPTLTGEQGTVMVVSSNYVNIQNCTIIGQTSTGEADNHGGIHYYTTTGGRVYNNRIYNVRSTSSNSSGLWAWYAYGGTIFEHNEIYNSDGGIFLKHVSHDMIIRFNYIHDVNYHGIRLGSSGTSEGYCDDNQIYQNLLVSADWGLQTGVNGQGERNVIANNTVYNSSDFATALQGNSGGSGIVKYYNNIIHTTSSGVWGLDKADPAPFDFEHNLWYGVTNQWTSDATPARNWAYWIGTYLQDTVSPAGISGANPLFANIAGSDFRLCTAAGVPHASCSGASPAIALGVDILNLAGGGTEAIIPAGAYITGNETIGIESGVSIPTLSTVTIGTTGNSWTFAYSEAVTCSSTPNCCDDFTVSTTLSGSVALSYSSGSGTASVVCTGNKTVRQNDTISVGLNYTTVADGIESASGGDLASFTNQAVTNNSIASGSVLVAPGGTAITGTGGRMQINQYWDDSRILLWN